MAAKVPIPVSISGGIDVGTHPHLQTRLEVMENCVYDKRGAVTKRPGNEAVGADPTSVFNSWTAASQAPQPQTAIHPFRSSSITIGANQVYNLGYALDSTSNGKRAYTAKISECTATIDDSFQSIDGAIFTDSARISDYVVSAWRTEPTGGSNLGKIYANVVDEQTGNVVAPFVLVATGSNIYSNVRVIVPSGATKPIFVYSDNAGNIIARDLNLSTWSFGSPTNLVTGAEFDSTLGTPFDAIVFGANFLVGYHNATTYSVKSFSTALSNLATGLSDETDATLPNAIGLAYDGSTNIYLAYSFDDSGTSSVLVRYNVFNTSLTRTLNSTTILSESGSTYTDAHWGIGICAVTSSAAYITVDNNVEYIYGRQLNAGGTMGTARKVYGHTFHMMSKPFYRSTEATVYQLILCDKYDNAKSLVVVDWMYGTTNATGVLRPACSVAPRQVPNSPTTAFHRCPPSINATGNTDEYVSVLYNLNPSTNFCSGPAIVKLQFNKWRPAATIGKHCVIAGGCPSSYDGSIVYECCFIETPRIASDSAGSGGSLTTNSTYRWRVVTEIVDSAGNVIRSAPSDPITEAMGANTKNTLTIYNVNVQNIYTPENAGFTIYRHVIYRTLANSDVYHRVGETDNLFGQLSATYEDTVADSTIALNPQLYTMGSADGDGRVVSSSGILDNVCPPSSRFVCAHANRFWLAGTPNDSIWYSKAVVPFEGVGFNEALTVPAFEGGRVIALASDGDRLLIFKSSGVWHMGGEGDNDAGTGGTLSRPAKISDNGCVDARSVVSTPFGVFYQSSRGIFYISKGGIETTFVGEDVRAKTDGYTITTAVFQPSRNWVRFARTTGATVPDELVYDIDRKTWSTFEYFVNDGNDGSYGGPRVACINGAGVYNWVHYVSTDAAHTEFVESSTSHLDAIDPATDVGTFVPMMFETGWLKLGELQGYQRVSRVQTLGELHTAHQLSMSEYTDYNTTANTSATRLSSAITGTNAYQYEFGVLAQRSQSIKLRFTDAQNGTVGTGKGATITSLILWASMANKKWRPAPSTSR